MSGSRLRTLGLWLGGIVVLDLPALTAAPALEVVDVACSILHVEDPACRVLNEALVAKALRLEANLQGSLRFTVWTT